MKKKFYKWYKLPQATDTMLEVTKDYFAFGDEYINEDNGWTPMLDEFIETGDVNG